MIVHDTSNDGGKVSASSFVTMASAGCRKFMPNRVGATTMPTSVIRNVGVVSGSAIALMLCSGSIGKGRGSFTRIINSFGG